jgi:flagellar hook-basal body complex protein FliE
MSGLDAIAAIAGQSNVASFAANAAPCAQSPEAPSVSFGELMNQALEHVEARVDHANALVRSFALGDSVPVHEVTIALEEARIAVELAMQVRSRVVEGYRELMNMHL